ncbi:MAG: tetratricopeptide repeat protein [Actinoallomurus sp.]
MYDRAARGAASERTVARIWRLTLDELTDVPQAGDLLRVLAWYGPEPIPRTLLDGLADAPRIHEALGALAAYNMITVTEGAVLVHTLVQAVARTADPADPHRRAADIDDAREHATRLLNEALLRDYRDPSGWPVWRALFPHVEALAGNAPPETDTATTVRLLGGTALFLGDQSAVGRAITFHRRAVAESGRILGADHPVTLMFRANLAYAHEMAGDPGRAIPLFERTLADRERVLGADHPDTLISRNNLAYACATAGDLERAVPLFERTLADCMRILGTEHPLTQAVRRNRDESGVGAPHE